MQPEEEDYYELSEIEQDFIGCCLYCEDAEPGCLCYQCRCTKCLHYTPPDESGETNEEGEEKGSCDLARSWKEARRKKREENKKVYAEMNEKNSCDYAKLGQTKPKDNKQKQLSRWI
jgi:hypothetical protein